MLKGDVEQKEVFFSRILNHFLALEWEGGAGENWSNDSDGKTGEQKKKKLLDDIDDILTKGQESYKRILSASF